MLLRQRNFHLSNRQQSFKTRFLHSWSQLVTLGIFALTFFSCQGGFQNQSSESIDGNEGALAQPTPPGSGSVSGILQQNKTTLDGRVDGGQYDQKLVVEVLPEQQAIALILPLPPGFYLGSFPLPPLRGIEIVPSQSVTQPELKILIPIRYLIKGSELGRYDRLPNGDPLPGMPAGETRGFSLSMREQSDHRIHVYFVASAVAVFVETPRFQYPEEIKPFLPALSFPVRNQSHFALVPDKGAYASGVFVASRLPPGLAYELDQILRY
jgi:hypothetical protein